MRIFPAAETAGYEPKRKRIFAALFLTLFALRCLSAAQTSATSTMVIGSSGSCVDISAGSKLAGAGVDEWTCTGASNQSFAFSPTSDGYYTIQPQNDNLCLDAGSGSVTTGIQVVQNACSGGYSQKWRVNQNSNGTYAVSSANALGCLDIYAGRTANGTIATTYACHGSTNESFQMPGFKATASFSAGSPSLAAMVIQSSGSCVDVNGGSNKAGLGIDQMTCSGTSNQNFIFTPVQGGYYTIKPQNDGLCLDAGSGSVTTGVQVVQNSCSGAVSQQWKVQANSDGSYSILTSSGAGCFDVYAGQTANGAIVTTYACHGSSNERFSMASFHPSTYTGQTATSSPTISPASGSYSSPLSVTITPAAAGTPIYYTTNGTTPTSSSTRYSAPISLTSSATIEAIAIASGSAPSTVVSANYTVQSPAGGSTASSTTMVIQSSGSCVHVSGSSTQAGAGIDEWSCTGANNQTFNYTPVSGGYYTIQPQSDGLCLDAGSGSVTTGVQIVQNPCSGAASQHWKLQANSNGTYSVLTSNGAGCFDVYDGQTANGTILTTYACHSAANESFTLGGLKSPAVSTPSPPAPSSTLPVIFNVSRNAQPGDVIYVQGANLGSSAQVWLSGAGGASKTQLNVMNSVGSIWLAAQLPLTWPGAMILSVATGSGTSSTVNLNGAVPFNLDALEIVPGGAFRMLGRNLLMSGYTPAVMVNGQSATINLSASTTNMLVVTAPASLSPGSSATITVDNGNGTGPATLDRTISVVAGSGDPFVLGVGWGAEFTFAGNVVQVNTACNGSGDDSVSIQDAINSIPSGGGVVQLPAGTCVLANSLTLHSGVVLAGAGNNATTIKYQSNYPISAQNSDLVGVRNLTLTNSGSAVQGLIWQYNTRSFLQNVTINMGSTYQLFLTNNQNFVVTGSSFIQGGSLGEQNPYLFIGCSGFVFSNNTSVTVDGSPTFQMVHDALILNNHFTRSAVNQNESPVIATHQFVMDFAYRMAILGNIFDVSNGPITNTNRNDGETLLTEGGGGNRTENEGTVGTATANSITDPNNVINVNPFGAELPGNYGVAIVSGTGAGQTRELIAYSNSTMQVDHAWDVIPDSTSRYATFVWGLEKTLIEGNTLIGNPRGIWLYQAAARDVDISNNTITNGGGIYLRAEEQNANGVRQFDPMYNIRIEGNNISNNDGVWMSYIAPLFVNADTTNFGTAGTGIEVRNNTLTANNPNVTTATEDRVTKEGFLSLMYSEASGCVLSSVPMLLGTLFQHNSCANCSTAFVIGSGDYGTILVNNTPARTSPTFMIDMPTLSTVTTASIGTLIQ